MSKRNSAWTQGHISCAFTGHRPHKFPWKDNEADPRCIALKETLAEQIAMLARAGVTEYFTGGADGVDCWAAEIVLTMREKNPALKLHCLLPHEGQADRWSDSAQERYHSILACCWLFSTEYGAAAPGQRSTMPGRWARRSS